MNREIVNFININKKLKENSTNFEMNYPINNLLYHENEIISDINSFKQSENVLYFKVENISNTLNPEKNSKNVIKDEKMITDESIDLNAINSNIITNIYVNSVNYSNKILLKYSIEKALSNINSNTNNLINSNPGYLIGAPFTQSYNNLNYEGTDDIRQQIKGIKEVIERKYRSLFVTVYRENNHLDIFKINSASVKRVFNSNIISELPCLLSDMRIKSNLNDYSRVFVDPTLEINIPNNKPQNINLAMPEQIFFDFLNQKLVLAILFKNGILVFYEAQFVYDKSYGLNKGII